jgi:hypothetical protein
MTSCNKCININVGHWSDSAIGTEPFHVWDIDHVLTDWRMVTVAVVGSVAAITKYYHVAGWTMRTETGLADSQFRIPTTPVSLALDSRSR